MAELAVAGPLAEPELADQLGANPDGVARQAAATAGAGVIISMSQGAVVSAGSHLVAIACQQTTSGAVGAVFSVGNITAIAAAA